MPEFVPPPVPFHESRAAVHSIDPTSFYGHAASCTDIPRALHMSFKIKMLLGS